MVSCALGAVADSTVALLCWYFHQMSRPNILFIVSDQERQRDWLPEGVNLPARQRLIDNGLEFTNHYTHTSPCSPARATLFTGQYLAEHGVSENSSFPTNTELSTDALTLGKLLREQGYTSAYKGKWHLEGRPDPDMEAYGFSDWEGNDQMFWGLAGSGTEYDEPIARSAADWIRSHGNDDDPWFLTVGLVNPHDIMWYPIDQPWYREREPDAYELAKSILSTRDWGRADNFPPFVHEIDRWFTDLPPNFADDLHTKPEVHRSFMTGWMNRYPFMGIERDDPDIWLRQLDYYVKLHELSDQSLGLILGAMDDIGGWDDTVVIFTADHGDQCGSHGLRSKGPWNYQETMRIPLYIVAPGVTEPATTTHALTSAVDLAREIAEFAGVNAADTPTLQGSSMAPLFADPTSKIRDYVLFSQEWAWWQGVERSRYASSGIFDGRYKYCRYYGIGGGHDAAGAKLTGDEMLFGRGAAFDEHDHELYDLQEDPHELVNLALDRGLRHDLRARFGELRSVEHEVYANGF